TAYRAAAAHDRSWALGARAARLDVFDGIEHPMRLAPVIRALGVRIEVQVGLKMRVPPSFAEMLLGPTDVEVAVAEFRAVLFAEAGHVLGAVAAPVMVAVPATPIAFGVPATLHVGLSKLAA